MEKLKIYTFEWVRDLLMRDASLFEIYRKDGTVNMNDFLNRLVRNYYDIFSEREERLYESIVSALGDTPDRYALARKIAENIRAQEDGSGEPRSAVISLKPVKDTEDIFSLISSQLNNMTLSGYFHRMFVQYASLPRDIREQIIFREKAETIQKAINDHRELVISMNKDPLSYRHVIPYAIASSKEEMFNYLLCEEDGRALSFRICRIRSVRTAPHNAEISEKAGECLEQMRRLGPQFPVREIMDIKIRMSEKGLKRYRSMYLHRPEYEKAEGDIYTFRCSPFQIMLYFARFDKDAVILEPAWLRNKMIDFHKKALEAYEKPDPGDTIN